MTVNVLFFGPLSDKISCSSIQVENIQDTDCLMEHLIAKFPQLKESAFSLSVNRTLIHNNTKLHHGDEVACLPPFSGG